MKPFLRACNLLALLLGSAVLAPADVRVSDPNIVFSPYNWYKSSDYAQTANPGAYFKVGFTGTRLAVKLDLSPLTAVNVPASHYPVVRYSVDGGPAKTLQLSPTTGSIACGANLPAGNHTLLFQYVAGYVFLDVWTPVNALRITGFDLDAGASLVPPSGPVASHRMNALFFGDSITNGDDDIATFEKGITNEVDTQDATAGYPSLVAAGIGAEYGIVAYGGASWDSKAADSSTPGLMTSYSMLDSVHSRLVSGKLSPAPDDVFINMGENSPPTGEDVPKLLTALRAASTRQTNIFLIVPFSGRSRAELTAGFAAYQKKARDAHAYLLDLGNNPYLKDAGPTMLSVDGQHPLTGLHAQLAAQIIHVRAEKLGKLRR